MKPDERRQLERRQRARLNRQATALGRGLRDSLPFQRVPGELPVRLTTLQPVTEPCDDSGSTVIGWFGLNGIHSLCDNEALVVTGTRPGLRKMMDRVEHMKFTPRSTTFAEIMRGINLGAAYAFDEDAYAIFRPLAAARGLALPAEDFSDPGPWGIHLLRVQKITVPR